MPRPIEAIIDSAALYHNLQRCRRAAGDAKVWAVVKANAYGHGIARVYPVLRAADGFALLDLDEADLQRGEPGGGMPPLEERMYAGWSSRK